MRSSRSEKSEGPCQLVVEDLAPDRLEIPSVEARHWLASLRARPGDTIAATDGRGGRAILELETVRGRSVRARVGSRRQEEPPGERLWLATRAPGPRFDWLVEKAAELGAWGIVSLGGETGSGRAERWRRVARAGGIL